MSEADRGEGDSEDRRREAAQHGDDGREAGLRDAVKGCAHIATVERAGPRAGGLAVAGAVCYGFGSSRRPAGVFAVSTIASSQARSIAGRSAV